MFIREDEKNIYFENSYISLIMGKDGKGKSLKSIQSEEELLSDDCTPLFSVTQDRYYNNELKLIHTSREITDESDGIRLENGLLFVSFAKIPYEAVIEVTDKESYFVFTLKDFFVPDKAYNGLLLANPPATRVRLLQLHLKEQKYFGEWMNVSYSDSTAVALMGTSPEADIGNEKTKDGRLIFSDAVKGIRLRGLSSVLIVSEKDSFLDKVDAFEEDFSLPRGVKSRKSVMINRSAYFVSDATPENIDEHIMWAKKGGFRLMLMYYTCFFKEEGYYYNGDYDFRDEYKNGLADIKTMLDKIKANGITPGFHFLHSHIGLKSRYFTPEADHRVMLRQRLTTAKPVSKDDTVIFVDEIPFETELPEKCRILRFGTELISYKSCTDTYPYCYKGCKRGFNGTMAHDHPAGTGGGVVFISEYGGYSGYIDQNSSLQDEIAEKIAEVYNQGFQFLYFDGSEGVNAPFNYQIPLAQLRVYNKLKEKPLFCEAAAKGHFSWHILSGGNAFDIFPTDIFKAMIKKYPVYEAPKMQMDFTRINFGWWGYFEDSRPDVFEYGTSKAAGFGCPVSIQSNLENFRNNPRTDKNLEVLRRWEEVRVNNLLSEEQKKMLQDPDREFTLIKNSSGEYELNELRIKDF